MVGDSLLTVALADDPDERATGLMSTETLGAVDGMLFVFEQSQVLSFWMKDTLIPLDIAFFDDQGDVVSTTTMTPCAADPCPRYSSELPALFAVEVPAGDFSEMDTDDRLIVSP
jgi:uncharacterized membrane protein (UPF0127 family)